MRTLTYFIAVSLDGYIAGPDRTDPTGFWPIAEDYLALLTTRYPETLPAAARQALGVTAQGGRFDTVLEGRRSYEIGLAAGVTDAYSHLRHLVFTASMTESPGDRVELIGTDPVTAVQALKRESGLGLWLVGGGELAGSLYSEIDQLILKIAPLTLGDGVPLFGRGRPFDLRGWVLAEHTVLDSGTVVLSYTASPR